RAPPRGRARAARARAARSRSRPRPTRMEPAGERPRSSLRFAAGRLDLGLEPVDLGLEIVDQAQGGGVEGPLVVRQGLHVPAHELPEDGLRGRPEAAADTRPESERTIGRPPP